MRISFPPIDKSFPFQPASFWPILSFRVANTCFFDLPIKDGRPKYFVCLVSYIGPRLVKISSLASWDVLGLKKIEDLSVLIFCPEKSSYCWRIFFNTWLSFTLALQKRIMTSAKRRWVTLGQPLQMDIPVKNWFRIALLISAESPSVQMRKSVGERGSPCLSPREVNIWRYILYYIGIDARLLTISLYKNCCWECRKEREEK